MDKALAALNLSDADSLCSDYGLDKDRVVEGLLVKKMIEDMSSRLEVGEKWYVVSMKWVK